MIGGDHHICLAQQRLEQAAIGIKARSIQDGVFHAEKC